MISQAAIAWGECLSRSSSIQEAIELVSSMARHEGLMLGHNFADQIDLTLAQWLNLDPSLELIDTPHTRTIVPKSVASVYHLKDASALSRLLMSNCIKSYKGPLMVQYLAYGDPFLVGDSVYLAGKNLIGGREARYFGKAAKGTFSMRLGEMVTLKHDSVVTRYNLHYRVLNLTDML